jgi:hypothetical protein
MGLGGEAVVSILVIVLDIHTVLLINGNIVYIVAACFSPLLLGNVVDLLNMKVITACDASDDEVCVLIAKTDSDRLIEVIDRLYRLGLAVNIKRDGVIGPLTAIGVIVIVKVSTLPRGIACCILGLNTILIAVIHRIVVFPTDVTALSFKSLYITFIGKPREAVTTR